MEVAAAARPRQLQAPTQGVIAEAELSRPQIRQPLKSVQRAISRLVRSFLSDPPVLPCERRHRFAVVYQSAV